MSKSTPIAQIPFPQPAYSPNGPPAPPFMNEPHRQAPAQAPAPVPAPAQAAVHQSTDEEDATIQETLQYFNASAQQPRYVAPPLPFNDILPAPDSKLSWLTMFNVDDLFFLILGAVAFVVVTMSPAHRIFSKYVNLEAVPHSETIAKAVLMGVVILLGRRVIINL